MSLFEPCQMEQYSFLCKNLEPFTVMLYKKKSELVQGESGETKNIVVSTQDI